MLYVSQESDVKSLEFQSAELKTELVQAKEMNEVLNKQLEELVRITESEDSKLDTLTKELLNLKESENEYQAQLKVCRLYAPFQICNYQQLPRISSTSTRTLLPELHR